MTVNFVALLKLANFPKEKIEALMKNIDYVTEDEKFRLSNLAWYFISNKYFLRLSLEERKVLQEVKEGKRVYNPSDLEEIKARLTHELAQSLQAADTQQSMEDIRKQLEMHKTKPLPVDSSPLPQKK
ncbi:hypothetical protein HYW55_06030 [Candidatus Gottesmanbacteria bacterium]|nr:hypothetical protein [Candidatus Gottesmanbacteria bacterium]